mgnify:FL=1
MSLEIDQKIMKAIILSIKDDFKEEDYAILENALERIKKSEQYETAQILWNVEGYKQILKQREYQNGFCSRLLYQYHEPISEFEIFIEHCIKIIHDMKYPEDKYPNTCKVLNGICARAILIANEILCLIKNGFASGALARWRTLYEYSVIAIAIIKFGEETACKYIAYNAITNYSEAKTYNEHSAMLGFDSIPLDELNGLKSSAEEAQRKYPDLKECKDYSWAKPHINKLSFAELAKITDINYYRPYYRFSCHYIHGTAKGIFYDLGQIYGLDEKNSRILARTNYGFTDPLQLTMTALLNIISATVSIEPDINMQIQIIYLRDKLAKIAESCYEVEKDIQEQEKLNTEISDIFNELI